jgi:adenylosuccinate lyase
MAILSSSSLFGPLFSSAAMRAVVDDQARLQRMLDFEAALAKAEAAYRERLEPLLDQISDPAALLLQLAEIDDAMDERWAQRQRERK